MTDVFISYKRRLRPRVEEIAATLRAAGVTVWYDAALEAGMSFSAEISNEVRTAGCVLVCWSDDAFPRGGDTSGWVVGEATIGHDRSRLVPVLLEEAELDPPWNTLHTESLIGWSPDKPDDVGWRNVLAAIGRHIGRPDLEQAVADSEPEPAAPRMPPSSQVAVAGLGSAAITALGAAVLAAIDPRLDGGYAALIAGAALAALPLAFLFLRSGVLKPWQAAGLVTSTAGAFALGAGLGIVAVVPLRTEPMNYDLAEIVVCAVAGLVGGGLSLSTYVLLRLAARTVRVAVRVGVAALVLAAVAGFIAAMPFFNLEVSNSAILWMGAIWQLVYAPLLVWVLRPQATRSASTM